MINFLNRASRKINRYLARISPVKTSTQIFNAPIVSFTFDDCAKSAITRGAKILESKGICGTYYVCGGLTDKLENNTICHSLEDLMGLKAKGHEIASHLFNHVRCEELTADEIREEFSKSKEFLSQFGLELNRTNFSYPFGSINMRAKKEAAREFATARGIANGINVSKIDLACLKANALYADDVSRGVITELIDQTIRDSGWLIFYTHDVDENPTKYGITPELLKFAAEYAKNKGCSIRPISDVVEQYF
ncbi:polysaccharide deacetylase family protein [Sneathiella aquimaris]|uniref:polysaccharide deacetylase family protein n=1 Tax=Sneathiella aquimaris TaxID=2599305 RepID=UPI00146CBA55|nr:polysaccharide deacetylase family protein [Sneathiella aquimaris]